MAFKVGETVVCVKVDNVDGDTGEILPSPKIGDEVIINFFFESDYIGLDGYPEYIVYSKNCFRKRLPPIKALVQKFKESERELIEYVPEEINIPVSG